VLRDPERGWISEISIDATDAEGRELHAVGHPVSRIIINRHSFIDINSLVKWDLSGSPGWGEDQDMWPMHAFSEYTRQRRGGNQ
jgi:hypothetical protein